MDLFTFRGTPVRAHWSVAAGIVLIFVSTATSWDADTGEDILMGLLASFSLYCALLPRAREAPSASPADHELLQSS